LSGYAYFAWRRIQGLCASRCVELVPHPVVFAKLLDHWGQLGPAEIAPKKEVVYRYGYRYAKLNGFEFNPPAAHPFNPLPALRLSLLEVAGEYQFALIDTLFHAGWTRGSNLGDIDVLAQLLDEAGLPAQRLLAAAASPQAKERLKRETAEAIDVGVFGVPSMVWCGELFWGNDQLEHLAVCIDGNDPLDREKLADMLARKRAVDRSVQR
jgi:2-hydroxychromene-2-carboxylate isomerase